MRPALLSPLAQPVADTKEIKDANVKFVPETADEDDESLDDDALLANMMDEDDDSDE